MVTKHKPDMPPKMPDLLQATTPATTPATTAPDPTLLLAHVPHTDDVVEYTLRCVLALAPGLTAAIQAHIRTHTNQHVREVFGGDRVYIARLPGKGLSVRNAQIRRDYKAGERIPLLERRYALSATRLWQIIKE